MTGNRMHLTEVEQLQTEVSEARQNRVTPEPEGAAP